MPRHHQSAVESLIEGHLAPLNDSQPNHLHLLVDLLGLDGFMLAGRPILPGLTLHFSQSRGGPAVAD